jgi:hypothetical protein
MFSEGMAKRAADGAAERRRQGYDENGRLGGPFNEENPPPGKRFVAYQKGCTGIVWEAVEAEKK